MMADICRFYAGYTLDRVADELDFMQARMLLEKAGERPWEYACLVEPKKP